MKNLKLICISLFFELAFFAAAGQGVLNTNVAGGLPLRSRNYVEVKGSPYRLADWCLGKVTQENGKVTTDMTVRYDELADDLTFKNEQGVEMTFVVPVTEFELNDSKSGQKLLFRKGFTGKHDVKPTSFVEVLQDGEFKLLRKNFKSIQENRAYNSATVTRTISDRVKFYAARGTALTELKRDPKALSEFFGEKWPAVETVIREQKLNVKRDEDLLKIFKAANTNS